jgi:hypothetical protein
VLTCNGSGAFSSTLTVRGVAPQSLTFTAAAPALYLGRFGTGSTSLSVGTGSTAVGTIVVPPASGFFCSPMFLAPLAGTLGLDDGVYGTVTLTYGTTGRLAGPSWADPTGRIVSFPLSSCGATSAGPHQLRYEFTAQSGQLGSTGTLGLLKFDYFGATPATCPGSGTGAPITFCFAPDSQAVVTQQPLDSSTKLDITWTIPGSFVTSVSRNFYANTTATVRIYEP